MTGYRLSRKAESDLSEIWDYSARHWGADQANRYVRLFAVAFEDIATRRTVGRSADDVRASYRKLPVGSHILFYREDAGTAVIMRILHKAMDVTRHL